MQNNQKAYQLFSAFKNKFYQDDDSASQGDADPFEMDAEMKQLLQKVNKQSKKSSATRLKALRQASELLAAKAEGYFDSFLKVFTIVFEKILTCEEDAKVLLELHRCMRTVITSGEAAMKRQFPQVFHYLYLATFEPHKELSEAARANLGLLLKSDDKVARSAFLFRDRFFAFVNGMLTSREEFLANMTIYDDKEVNELTYRKLVAMVWWAVGDMVAKATHLRPNEREQLFEKVVSVAFEPARPLSLQIFNGAGGDYVAKTALLYFWALVLETGVPVDNAVLKKVCQTLLLNNLDDPNTSFQAVLWRNGFVLRLLELGRTFGVSSEAVAKKFQTLVESHCFGVGKPYLAHLSGAVELLAAAESQGRAEQLLKRVIHGHFKSVTRDDLKFDVREHYRVGFGLLRDFTVPVREPVRAPAPALASGLAPSKEGALGARKYLPVKFSATEVFEPVNWQFFTSNVHTQKNLNALSVNLVKFYPLELRQFLAELDAGTDEISVEFRDAIRGIVFRLADSVLGASLADQKIVANLGIYLKHLLGGEAEGLAASPTIGHLVTHAFGRFAAVLAETLGQATDANFPATLTKLQNLRLFAGDLLDSSVTRFLARTFAADPAFPSVFKNFTAQLAVSVNTLVVRQEIRKSLLNPANSEAFSEQLCEMFALFAPAMDLGSTVAELAAYSESHVLEVKNGNWARVVSLLIGESAVKTLRGAVKVVEESPWEGLALACTARATRQSEGARAFARAEGFWKLYGSLAAAFFGNGVLGYAVVLLQFAPEDRVRAGLILTDRAVAHLNHRQTVDLSPPEAFKLAFVFEAAKEIPEEHVGTIFEAILANAERSPSESLEKLGTQAGALLAPANPNHVAGLLLALWARLASANSVRKDLLSLFKNIAAVLGHNTKALDTQELRKGVAKIIREYFEGFRESGHVTTDTFRLAGRLLPQVDLPGVVRTEVRAAVTAASHPHTHPHTHPHPHPHPDPHPTYANFLTHLIAQPNLLHNFSVKKQRQFWSQIVFGPVLDSLVQTAGEDLGSFLRVLDLLLAKSAINYALIVFVRALLARVPGPSGSTSVDPETRTSLLESLKAFFEKQAVQNPSDPSILFAFKAVLEVVDVRQLYQVDKLVPTLFSAPRTPLKSLLLLSILRSNALPLETLALALPAPAGAGKETKEAKEAKEGTALGRVLAWQVEQLRNGLGHQHLRPFFLTLLLDTLDLALEKHEEQIIAEHTHLLEAEFVAILAAAESGFAQPFSQNCFHAFLILLRKLIVVLEVFSDNFRSSVFARISLSSFRVAVAVKQRRFVDTQFWTIPPEEFFDEIAETISRFSIREDSSLEVSEVLELLEIDINSVKKSAYFLVQKFKEPLGVSREQLAALSAAEDPNSNLSSNSNPATALMFRLPPKLAGLVAGQTEDDRFTFCLKWAYLLGVCVDQSAASRLNFDVLSRLFTEEKAFFGGLMGRLLSPFQERQLNVREIEDEIRGLDFGVPDRHWGDSATEVAESAFALHVFFHLTHLFPKNLRGWLETDRLAGVAQTLLRARVSEAIYLRELDKIELTQHEWKADDFDLFFNRNTREVSAVYLKDGGRFEVELAIPPNYPVKPIGVRIGGTVKTAEAKERKWELVIKKALMGHNNNVIDALMIWKRTMDAEYEGVEPCSICYSVIHETSKKLPTMACRTCKKLFHPDCIHQWFASSHKSECPLCKSQFM